MPTIQKRLRFHATVRSNGTVLASKSFGPEMQARAWVAKHIEVASQQSPVGDDLSSAVKQRTSYRVMVRLRGYPAQYATFGRLTDAKRWGHQTEAAIREGRHFKTSEARKHTAAELIDRYSREVLSHKSESKRRDQERHLKWWKARIGSRVLADVTPALISENRTTLATEITVRNVKRAPGTVNRYLSSLGHVFAVAEREWGWIDQNPVRKVSKLKEPRGRVRFLSDDERQTLFEACRKSIDGRLYPLVVLALSTGARQGELLGLRWRDCYLTKGVAVLQHTKNEERRALPLACLALELLKGRSKVRRLDTDLVFANRSGRAVFPRKSWERALKAARIEDFRWHDLRHSAASYLAMNGATLAEIAEVLGHKTLAMVKRYSHLTESHTASVVARMNERFIRA